MSQFVVFLNSVLSIISGFIYCAAMCSSLKMRSNVLFWGTHLAADVIVGALKLVGLPNELLSTVYAILVSFVFPLAIGTGPISGRVAKGAIGSTLFFASAIASVVPLLLYANNGDVRLALDALSVEQTIAAYLVYWPFLTLVMTCFTVACKRFDRIESDITILPFVGFLAVETSFIIVGIAVANDWSFHGGVQYHLVMSLLFVAYLAVCGFILWRHVHFQRSRRSLRRQELLNAHLEALQSSYQGILESHNRLRKVRHDLANHLQAAQFLVDAGNGESAKQHLELVVEYLDKENAAPSSPVDGELIIEIGSQSESSAEAIGFTSKLGSSVAVFVVQLTLLFYVYCNAVEYSVSWYSVALLFALAVVAFVADILLVRSVWKKESDVSAARLALSEEATRSALEAFEEASLRQSRQIASLEGEIRSELYQAIERLQKGDTEGASEKLGMGLTLADSSERPLCENAIASAVIAMEKGKCANDGVTFSCDGLVIPADTTLSQTRMAALLFNLLDNAIHGSEGVADQRWVSLKARPVNRNLVIVVENPCDRHMIGTINPLSINRYKQGQHGWGLEIVHTIVSDCDGIALFEADGKTFVATVTIPL